MKNNRRREIAHHIVFLLLVPCVYGLLLWTSYLHPFHWDMTRFGRYSLSETGRTLAERLPDEVELIAFVRREKDRRSVRRFIQLYQQHSRTLKLTFIDPWTDPEAVNRHHPKAIGEIIVLHDGRRHRLSPERSRNNPDDQLRYREEDLNRIFGRLIRDKAFTIHFLAGHGERLPMEQTNRGFSVWGSLLKQSGYMLEGLSPAQIDQLPDIRLLVIASPQIPLAPDEAQHVLNFVEQGGNLLWLTDPGSSKGLDDLAASLHLKLSEQAVITTRPVPGIPEPDMLLPDPLQYGAHPVLTYFALQTLFIKSQAIRHNPSDPGTPWRYTALIQSDEQTTTRDGADKGPFDLVVALERPNENNNESQRVVVMGDGDLFSNTYLENGGNAEFGRRLIDWLARNENNLAVPPSFAPDATLSIPPTIRSLQLIFFVGFLPAVLIIGSIVLRRHRQHL